ncbi:hypothetical protein RK21_05672 [Pseudomonas plecoglossicida]|nr:hypothetical protein RK21_05672 [Pseudomonas plecoglossicida]
MWVACAGLFAGEPAPTGIALPSGPVPYLWERVHPRRGQYRLPISSGCQAPANAAPLRR